MVGILWICMIMVRFYFPACTLNWVQARTRAPMGVCQTLSPSSKNGKGSATPDYLELALDEHYHRHWQTRQQNRCKTGEECECEELRFRRGSPLACRVMCFASYSLLHCIVLNCIMAPSIHYIALLALHYLHLK